MKIPATKVNEIPQGIRLGDMVKFYKNTTAKTGDRKIWYEGVVYGYEPSALGGRRFRITNLKVIHPKMMNVDAEKVIKVQ